MTHRQGLHSKLTKARQELQQAQSRVAELEAQLFAGQPNPTEQGISKNTYTCPLDTLVAGCQIIGFDWRYLYINDAAAQHERHSKEELLGHTLIEQHPGIKQTPLFAVLQRCMHERSVEHSENAVNYPDGSSAWFELLVQPVPEGIFILALDITARKQTELALRGNEQQFRLFMEHAPAAFAMLDTDMQYLLVSQRWLTDYRLGETNVIGRSHYALFPDLPEQWKEIHQRCLAGAVESSEADPFPRADGSLDWVRWEIHPWRKLDGTIGGLLILSEVITERKRAEEHIRKLHRTLGVLSDINQAIVRIRHLPSVFEKACAIAVEKGAFCAAWIGLFAANTARIDPVAYTGLADNQLEKLILPLNSEPFISALHAGERLIYNDMQNDAQWLAWREEASQLNYRSMIALPLIVAGEIRGSFNLYAGETNFFDEQEMRLMDETAADISFAIEVAEQDEQRQQIEAALHTSEEKYRSLIESSESSIAMFDERGVLLYANQIAANALSLTQEEAVGRQMHELFPAPVAQYQLNSIQQVVRTGEGTVREAPSFLLGEERWQRTSVQPIRDAFGKVTSALINAVDITRLKRAEADLRNERDSLEQKVTERTADLQAALASVEAILNNSPDVILLAHADLTILQANSSFKSLFGAGWEEYCEQSLLTLFQPDAANKLSKLQQIAADQQNGRRIEVRAIRKDGTTFDAELNVGAIQGAGLVCIIRDITERKAQERQLRYHAALQENVSDAVIATDMELRIQSWNQAAVRIYGWTAEEAIGKVAPDLLHIRFPHPLPEVELAQFNEQGFLQQETIQRRKDGADLFILGSATRLDDERGVPVGIIAINRDITERKQAEVELREAKHRYHALFEQGYDAIFLVDMQGKLMEVNQRAAEMLGYSREELLNLSYRELSGEVPQSEVLIKQLLAGERIPMYERLIRKKDGSRISVEIIIEIVRDLTGKPRHIQSVIRDIMARKRAEEAIRESEGRYRLLAENIADIIMTFSPDRLITYISPSCEGLLGYLPEEVEGKSHSEFIHPEDYPQVIDRTRQAVAAKENFYTNQFRLRHKAGHYIWYEVRTRPVCNANTGNVVQFISILRDITERRQAEEALRESEEKFRLLLDMAPVATIISDQTGQISLVNGQAERLFGYRRAELTGQMVEILVPDYARDRHVHNRMTYLTAPHVRPMGLGMELYAKRKDGSEAPVEIELSYIETRQGIMVMSFIMDITERKRIAAELERQRSFLRNVIDVSPSIIFVKDYDGRFVLANSSGAALYNTTIEALVGKTDADFCPIQQEADYFLSTDRRVITSGEMLFVEEPFTNSTGKVHWLQTTKVPIVSADGQAKYVLGVATDITERKEAEEALRASEEKYRSLIETMRDGLAVFDPELRVTFVNERFCELLGYSSEEAIGKQPVNFVDAADLPFVQAHLERRQSAESTAYELPVRHKDGHPIHLLLSGTPLFDKQGNYNGSLVVATDISLQKQAEVTLRQALAKEKELGDLKTRFVSMASHEFRTPLATILALVETLSVYRKKLSEEQIEQRFAKIKAQIGHLKSIMEDVLMLARMQARRVEFNPVKQNLDTLCRSVLDEFQSQAAIQHRLEYSVSEGLYEVLLDQKLMRQIINNLVSNALKYSPSATPIRVTLTYTKDALTLSVADEGIGIPEADLPHLFEPFHRAANVGTISGTGLGLVIIREAVELHGGAITVESQEGVGTTFLIRIPIPATGEQQNNQHSDQ